MKKLLIAMMSVASLAFISKAEAINSGTTFENYSGDFGADKDDGGGNNGTFWYTAGSQSECGTLTNIDYTASYNGEHGRPAIAQGAATATALAVEAEQRLERGIANYSGGFAPQDIGSGIYFDTMVQFTATDIVPKPDAGDKLIVWLYGSDDAEALFGATTSLVVTAGKLGADNAVSVANYIVRTNAAIEPNTWHRLTIKAIEDIGTNSGVAGFVVFIDGVETTCEDARYTDDNTVFANLNATAASWMNKKALFPSLVETQPEVVQKLSSVALEGTGMIDDISFTSVAPDFAADGISFRLNWTEGLSTLTVNGETPSAFVTGSAGYTDIVVVKAGMTYTVAATAADGFKLGVPTTSGSTIGYADGVFTVNGTGEGTITAIPSLFQVNGAGDYASLAEAMNHVSSDKDVISLMSNYTGDQLSFEKSCVLDLAGHNVVGTVADNAAICVSSGKLVIIDSVGGGVISGGDPENGTSQNYAELVLGASTGDAGITVDGIVYHDGEKMVIVRGKFELETNLEADIAAMKDENSSIITDNTYIIVTPGEGPGPQPTTYELTIPEVTGATAAVTKGGVAVTDLTKIAKGTTVVVTWTATEGYKITAGATEQVFIMDENKVATAPTVKAIQYATVTITPVDNCTITVKNGETVVATGAKFDIDDEVTLTVTRTPADGYELDNCQTPESVTLSEAKEYTITAAVKPVSSGKTYPTYIPAGASEATKAKFDTWSTSKAGGDRDTASANMEAFLLNVAPDADLAAEKANFKVTAITVNADGSVTVTTTTTNSSKEPYNGTVKVKGKVNLTDSEWLPKDDTQHRFFKAFLEVE